MSEREVARKATRGGEQSPSQHSTPTQPRPPQAVCFFNPPSETNCSSQCCLPGALQSGKLQPGQSSRFHPGCRSSSLKNTLRSVQASVTTSPVPGCRSPRILSSCLYSPSPCPPSDGRPGRGSHLSCPRSIAAFQL